MLLVITMIYLEFIGIYFIFFRAPKLPKPWVEDDEQYQTRISLCNCKPEPQHCVNVELIH
jgi:hypothetical protein